MVEQKRIKKKKVREIKKGCMANYKENEKKRKQQVRTVIPMKFGYMVVKQL